VRLAADGWAVESLDQTRLPGAQVPLRLTTWREAAEAIASMRVRGAPLIGATAAYGLALAARADPSDASLEEAARGLAATRPTAVNLAWALDRVLGVVLPESAPDRARSAYREAEAICAEDVAANRAIGEHGLALFSGLAAGADRPVQILTHCNAGRLATVGWGTATAPIYLAHARGLGVHVWVSETRPRNQGALTAWELARAGVPHTVVADSACGHLLLGGRVDCCLVGTDRTTAAGDVANKIGTLLKALAAREANVPFWVAAPSSSIDWSIRGGDAIPIEERDGSEVRRALGLPAEVPVANPAFDVTPARLVSGLITERGVAEASAAGLADLFPDHFRGDA
jgi:methylthioribose-1-phosphate isomerase